MEEKKAGFGDEKFEAMLDSLRLRYPEILCKSGEEDYQDMPQPQLQDNTSM